ncbi:thiolase-like protein [Aspergillus karnatakaensis]|uniref:thiolase-like protein n=1 Tax=Aspergillus karnatakaensis TaxID=1810916 RepID=UPI003CCDA9BB
MAIHTMERAIAYELVIELLAHQFAFPVQWIETQKTLLKNSRRLVELGPSRTLLGMAQKMIEQDPNQSVQLLASTQDLQQLCYVYDQASEDSVTDDDEPIIETPQSSITVSEPDVIAVQTVQTVPDTPLRPMHIIRALVARRLRRSVTDIDPSRSLKDLCGGKSTLQNELIGELANEFPSLPDRAEDVPLVELDAALGGGSSSLGRTSAALLQRVFTAKMPARVTIPTVRTRLATVWGLPVDRQTAVLVGALAAEPQSRLASLEAAHQYWDGLAEAYSQSSGLLLQKSTPQQTTASQLSQIDAGLQAAADSAGSKTLARKQYEALRQFLGMTEAEAEAKEPDLQQKLDCWSAEFSDDFLDRISPRFDGRKGRWYRDSWNTARQELLAICQQTDFVWTRERREFFVRNADSTLVQIADAHPTGRDFVPILDRALNRAPVVRLGDLRSSAPRTVMTAKGAIEYEEHPRQPAGFVDFFTQWVQKNCTSVVQCSGDDLTSVFLNSLNQVAIEGISFTGRTYLLTGAGAGSIGAYIARRLLYGGSTVIITTSREPSSAAPFFKGLYDECASRGSRLHLVPFNQASVADCERLIDYIYSELGLDLDGILPFAATSQVGTELDGLDAGNELAIRLMLVNVLRVLGFVVSQKRRRAIRCRPTQVVLPLSPNHGILGGDGLYAESKRGLETLLQWFHSESWDEELAICGVSIGWTRSTGLMTTNDLVAEAAEEQGHVLTFSGPEMADLISLILSPSWATQCEDAPIMADFSGNLARWKDASMALAVARGDLRQRAGIARAIAQEDARERQFFTSTEGPVRPRVSLRVGYPTLPNYDSDIHHLQAHLEPGLVPADAVVVVGFAELGPWGSARVRWEMESRGQLSAGGYVEMAWLLNLIRHVDNGQEVGWVDAETAKPVADMDIEKLYGERIRSSSGIRPLRSTRQEILQEIVLEEQLPPFETTRANADALRQRHGNLVRIIDSSDSDDPASTCQVQLQSGASIRVPKSAMSGGGVAGQLPTGFSPEKFGIPADIVQQMDPVALVLLCCVAEAFYSAGMPDFMEVFEHIHLAEFGNFVGSSMGGVVNTRALYHDAFLDLDVPSDALQETYLNTAPAWVNMLLLGAAGPIKTPVGACATALESLDSAVDSIHAGQTKICLVGGYDDLQPEESTGFARMKATVSVKDEVEKGRAPHEMSRPTAASRAGFVESQGCGVQLVCRGDVALAMGLPVYGIIAGTGMASDGISRSVPAPGQGIFTFAKEDAYTPAPLRTALSRWGLGIDDLTVASLHATSTPANDTNEPSVIQREMVHLGRTPGHPLWAICQKSITGHPKAPAAAWMLNGCLQVLDSGLIPGNRNADDIDPVLQAFDHLCFPTQSVQATGIKSFLLNSCGFGQKEAQMVGVHPRYFFALQSRGEFDAYKERVQRRTSRAERAFIRAMMENRIVRVQSHPPFEPAEMHSILLNPSARIRRDASTGTYHVTRISAQVEHSTRKNESLTSPKHTDGHPSTVGVDTVSLSSFCAHENAIFLERNYTTRELESLHKHRDFRSAVASGWAAKEAVFKCLGTESKGGGAAMKEIEIVRTRGAPLVVVGTVQASGEISTDGDSCMAMHSLQLRRQGWRRCR